MCVGRRQGPTCERPGSRCGHPGAGERAPSKPANGVTTDLEATNPSIKGLSKPDISKPANGVTTDSGSLDLSKLDLPATPEPPSASACAPYREIIELSLSRGRNAMSIWQDLVSDHGFSGSYQSMKRFVRKLRGSQRPGAVGIIQTGPGKKDRSITVMGRWCAIRRRASTDAPGCS